VLLSVLLELKSRHEESMLLEHYPEYGTYRERVRRRFVPGIY
jgi:protein-S-isoprenylcysteine O-methyltransferase Ste14